MRLGGSRIKGAAYERKVVRMLREACDLGISECFRTPLSGGHPSFARSDIQFAGPMRNHLNICIECKHHSKVSFGQALRKNGPTGLWSSWLKQVTASASEDGSTPILVARVERSDWAVGPKEIVAGEFPESLKVEFQWNDRWWLIVPLEDFVAALARKVNRVRNKRKFTKADDSKRKSIPVNVFAP